ncbi:MAG: hypothetical protein MR000_10825 [Cloacibacillus porcorum]|uniref:hypothetical protein n=1 Tax=Cloacibacillus porcorum TaxID=1197717 RepID=UPI00235755DA|nr:hypothetical protein [Cloacibacillus porcorum]MCI5865710.1 hypothetical protein [Cloacibacillus porcorum]
MKVRDEIFHSIMSGEYSSKEHILGEISYINFIERENKSPYSSRLKEYIKKICEKIKNNKELVNAYNENLFYEELRIKDLSY